MTTIMKGTKTLLPQGDVPDHTARAVNAAAHQVVEMSEAWEAAKMDRLEKMRKVIRDIGSKMREMEPGMSVDADNFASENAKLDAIAKEFNEKTRALRKMPQMIAGLVSNGSGARGSKDCGSLQDGRASQIKAANPLGTEVGQMSYDRSRGKVFLKPRESGMPSEALMKPRGSVDSSVTLHAPGNGYGDPAHWYNAAPHGYDAPAPWYDVSAPGYGAPAPGYGTPADWYGAAAPGYNPTPSWYDTAALVQQNAPAAAYGAAPWYDASAPGYDAPEGVPQEEAVPGKVDGDPVAQPITTMMICDIPSCQTIEKVIEVIDMHGFANRYDFVYMPVHCPKGRRTHNQAMKSAFVNFKHSGYAAAFERAFCKFTFPDARSAKTSWAKPARCQGYKANLEMSSSQPLPGDFITFP